jgi:hypothetical protein
MAEDVRKSALRLRYSFLEFFDMHDYARALHLGAPFRQLDAEGTKLRLGATI